MGVLSNILLGNNGGLMKSALKKMTQRDQFSNYLPYVAYGEDERLYVNTDETIGFIWECTPLVYAGEQTFSNLSGLFSTGVPEGSILQFMLYADPHIDFILDSYKKNKIRQNELVSKVTESIVKMYKDGARGIGNLQGIPARNFRLFVSLKIPQSSDISAKELYDIRDIVQEILKGADLNPEPVPPEVLINLLMKLFNENPKKWSEYDETIPINKQIILSDTKIETSWKEIKISGRHFRCMTPKKLPVEIDTLTSNILTGDIKGFTTDSNQYKCPFIYSVNYIFEKLSSKLHFKCNFVLGQKKVGSLAPSLERKQEEYMWATDQIERGAQFIRVMPMLWLISENPTSASENMARAKRIWESKGFTTQEDKGILNILFLSSLPFGLYNTENNIEFIERDFILNGQVAAKFAPIQADFCGVSEPVDLYVGRKGQLACLNIFDSNSTNHNCMVAANSGAGKSFFMNWLLFNNYATGGIIRIIDIGGSYRKMCDIVGGKYISFAKDSNIILNPFSNIVDINDDQSVIAAILAQMIYSSTAETPSEIQMTLLKQAIRYTYEKKGTDGQVDDVYDYLMNFEKIHKDENANLGKLAEEAFHMGYNLQDFTSKGVFGKWFHGKSNLNISTDDFVVLELEELKPQVELFRVVILQLINYITNNLYQSNRSQRRIIVFDESWQFLGKSGDTESRMMEDVIEGGFRRARKYNGSFITIFQSLMDLVKFGGVGNVIKTNSAYKFLMQSDDYDLAKDHKFITYPEFLMEILKSVFTPRPRYSEIFMQTPIGAGVVRLLVDPISYWMFTSDANENKLINQLVTQGKSYAEAFEILANMPN
ncbi:MAG: type IV secretion system protein TraC [Proteobacteria bacterium]|nr:type IV secretion system protein TraC [Pseudomonadota bacterium]